MLFLSLSLLAASCSKNMYTAGMDKVQKSEFEALASSLEQSIDYEKNYIRMMQKGRPRTSFCFPYRLRRQPSGRSLQCILSFYCGRTV